MSLIQSEIRFYLTNSVVDPNLSLGGAVGTVTLMSAAVNGFFAIVSPEEAAGTVTYVKYRAIDVKNINVTDTAYGAYLYIDAETTSANTTVALAYDTGIQSVVNENTAPSAPTLTFSTPMSKSAGIYLGDIAPLATKRIWLRRTITPTAAKLANDLGTLAVECGIAA